MLSDIVTLFTWRKTQLPANDEHPLGYYKYDALGSLFVSVCLLGSGLSICVHSIDLLIPFLNLKLAVGLHAHSIKAQAFWYAAVSVFVKEILFQYSI